MTGPLRLRIYVSEPFNFERWNEHADLYGATFDHHDESNDEWVIELERWFHFNDADYDSVLVAPRYVGEQIRRVFDALVGIPVRIAHRTPEGWHFAMTGMLSLPPLEPGEADDMKNDDDDGNGDKGNDDDGNDGAMMDGDSI